MDSILGGRLPRKGTSMKRYSDISTPAARRQQKMPWLPKGPAPVVHPASTLNQRFDISWLLPDGLVEERSIAAPATPLFLNAFTAFARGTILQTHLGERAIEDVMPGDIIQTVGGPAMLEWKGSTAIQPSNASPQGPRARLFRIPTDALGPGRPGFDLLMGSGARLVSRNGALQEMMGTDSALIPVAPLVDGVSVIEITPATAVRTYHLGFRDHRLLSVNGVEVESLHPGPLPARGVDDALRERLMTLFPHKRGIEDFGRLALPRAADVDLPELTVA